MKLYFNIILLLLAPAILLSDDWEKVDLPNLNNGIIKNVYYYDSIYVFQRQDGEYLITSNFEDWEKLDTSSVKEKIYEELKIGFSATEKKYLKEAQYNNLWNTYNRNSIVYYNQDSNHIVHEKITNDQYNRNFSIDVGKNKSKSIINKDKHLYFLYSDTLYVIDSTKVSKYKVDTSIYNESALMARLIDGDVYLRSTVTKYMDIKHRYFTTKKDKVYQMDSSDVNTAITNNFLSGIELEFHNQRKYEDKVIPDNTFIEDIYVNNDILRISSGFLSFTHYDLQKEDVNEDIDLSFIDSIRFHSYRYGDYNIIFKNDYKSKSEIVIYNSKFQLVKKIKFEFDNETRDNYCWTYNYFGQTLILGCGNDIYELNLETLEYKKILEFNYTFHEFSEELILKSAPYYDPITETYNTLHNDKNSSVFKYSFDGGKNWTEDTLYAEISDKQFNTCSRGDNSHSISLLGETIYSFTKDTIFVAQVEQGNYNSLIALNYEYKIKYKDKYYVMDFDNGKIYVLDRNGEYTTILPPTENVVDFSLDNGYLYIANNKEIFRLKLE